MKEYSQDINNIENLAVKIQSKGLTVPAICLLEMYKPLAGLGHAALLAFSPLMSPVLGSKVTKNLISFCENRENIESFISYLEEGSKKV